MFTYYIISPPLFTSSHHIISRFLVDSVASQMLTSFVDYHDKGEPVRIDTARIYAGGDSEKMLGRTLANLEASSISLGTKAHPSQPNGLSPAGIRTQLNTSLEAMKVKSVNEFYLHQPDDEHSLLDSLKTLNELVEEGTISAIGMSNYHASEVQRAFDLCNEHDLAKPSVYQGLYNPLNRCVEDELLPVLRANGCSFVAYNPLAAGLLTGTHQADGDVKEGRFKGNQNYLPRFYTPVCFRAIGLIQSACTDANVSMVEASYRWLLCHSALQADNDDGVLIGASSMQQLEENLSCCARAKDEQTLPQPVLKAFEEAWEIISNDSTSKPFPYWRSYSADMPSKKMLDPGAAYNAAKAK
jgi:aflatoxin B1 aldehyde reductase